MSRRAARSRRTRSSGSPPSPRPSRRSRSCSSGSRGWSTSTRRRNDYLRAFRLVPVTARRPARHGAPPADPHRRGPRGAPSGRPLPAGLGRQRPLGDPVPSLAEFYRGAIRLVAEPGTRFAYTNHGFAALQQIVEDVSGDAVRPIPAASASSSPLGMVDSRHRAAPRWMRRDSRPGTRSGPRAPSAVVDREWVTAGRLVDLLDDPRHVAGTCRRSSVGGSNEHGTCSVRRRWR